jgi:gluconolactonase
MTSDWQPSARYPDPAVAVVDESFNRYRLPLGEGRAACHWTHRAGPKGPVWIGDARCLVWSDVPGNRMWRWDEESGATSVFRSPSANANGNTRDRKGGSSRASISAAGCRGPNTTAASSRWPTRSREALQLAQRHRLQVDGSIWFTDPSFGILGHYEGEKAEPELPTNVYRVDAAGTISVVAEGINQPNGLAFSPDESILYIVESRSVPRRILACDVVGGTTLRTGAC